ncbi:pentatricopeptide repeat-containing protein At2g01510, mitochondrial [Asparagus officinalis]|uniref:pentatricopeptide repeat-containing protein At2g01510, mitochondrial n=1 Tax=Asparagus officinalis TaxID=4686 RepID=UPI00098E1229|nr:pentatricopeptide repeat-containing protein At2g01510, mitochondrial [Asparagus officinalis]
MTMNSKEMLPFSLISKTHPQTEALLSLIHQTRYQISPKSAVAILLKSNSNPAHLKQIHSLLLTTGLTHKNSLLTRLLENLIRIGDIRYARKLFDEIPKPRVFLWSTLIRAYFNDNLPFDAISLYLQMGSANVRPDSFTFPFVVKACAEVLNVRLGMAVHGQIVKYGLHENAIVGTELMVMYAKFGDSESADCVFDSGGGGDGLSRDLVFWNALISAYAQNGNASRALALYRRMESDGIEPDAITLVSAISSCAYLGCLDFGRQLHSRVKERVRNVYIENALIDMYSKCGSMDEASKVFSEMGDRRNVVSWSTMIGGYAVNGDSDKALSLFSRMKDDNVKPNSVTMLAVLSACSHAGLVSEGKKYFYSISRPTAEHYATMVDLLGRSGHLEEAFSFIKNMPIEPDAAVWGALLGSCTIYHDTSIGQIAADELYKLAPSTPSYQVLLSNMYAVSERWDDVHKIRKHMRGNNLKKVSAYSSVELDGEVHVFSEGSRSQCKEIYEKLGELDGIVKAMGYRAETGIVLHDVEVEEKEAALRTHSEKLAITFSLLYSRGDDEGVPLRIMKNLRVCNDCHTFFKYVSKALGREIIMRDKNRFHHFRDGRCSCNDFW